MIHLLSFLLGLLLLTLSSSTTYAHDPAHYPQMHADTLNWFRSQKVPGTQSSCCNEQDGVYAEEDIRYAEYWTRFEAHGKATGWMRVPPEVVIHDPNRNGAPVVWYWYENGTVKIRCYSPGGGV